MCVCVCVSVCVCEQGAKGLESTNWPKAMAAVKSALDKAQGNEIKAIFGKLSDAETMIAGKVLCHFHCSLLHRISLQCVLELVSTCLYPVRSTLLYVCVCVCVVYTGKDLLNRLGSGNYAHEDDMYSSEPLSADVRSSYLTNTTVAGFEKADMVLLVSVTSESTEHAHVMEHVTDAAP